MKNGATVKNILMSLALLVLVAALAAICVIWSRFAIVDWKFYPKNVSCLDVTDEDITPEQYASLQHQLPGSWIIWNVPFSGGGQASNSKTITVSSLTTGDLELLQYLPQLKTIRGENIADEETYAILMDLRSQGTCEILYNVEVAGESYPQDAVKIQAKGFTQADADAIAHLPDVTKVTVSDCEDYPLLRQLRQEHPRWNLEYTVAVGSSVLNWDTKQASVTDVDFRQLELALYAMPYLKSLSIHNTTATTDELNGLRLAYPKVDMLWEVEVFGSLLTSDTSELDISGHTMTVADAKALASGFPGLQKLIMTDCGISNEEMAAFREEMRDSYKVVWTVYPTSKTSCRTDASWFFPTQQGEYYFKNSGADLKYCEELVAIDVGEHAVIDISFVQYMPHLQYLILAHTRVSDLTPLASCKELVFLELDWSEVKDYSPLVECTALEDLNLGQTYGKVDPILKMTWLKNLWWKDAGTQKVLQLQEALPDTNIMWNIDATVAGGWRNLPNYYKMRDALHASYMTW